MEWLAATVSGALLASIAMAQTARLEIHSFDTVTLTEKEFLTGVKEGKPARIGGELRLPIGSGPFPAVILAHGSSGPRGNVDRWAQELNRIGVAAFIFDSFTGRKSDYKQVPTLTSVTDIYSALELLARDQHIDRSRIATMGFSLGGFGSLYSSLKRFQRMHAPADVKVAAHIAFYPLCIDSYIDEGDVSDVPIRIFHGTADSVAPIQACRDYVEKLRKAGKDIRLIEYTGARHGFDMEQFRTPADFPNVAFNGFDCRWQEHSPGEFVNRKTGRVIAK